MIGGVIHPSPPGSINDLKLEDNKGQNMFSVFSHPLFCGSVQESGAHHVSNPNTIIPTTSQSTEVCQSALLVFFVFSLKILFYFIVHNFQQYVQCFTMNYLSVNYFLVC